MIGSWPLPLSIFYIVTTKEITNENLLIELEEVSSFYIFIFIK